MVGSALQRIPFLWILLCLFSLLLLVSVRLSILATVVAATMATVASGVQRTYCNARSVSLLRRRSVVPQMELLDLRRMPTVRRRLPTLKLISAMKGSRQKNGMASQTENRHVKWASDVYDPPVTSVCHSVSYSDQRRSKSRKKDKNKQKQKHKGRSKKNQHNASQNSAVLQAPGLKDVGTSSGGSAADYLGKHETEILDYGISSQEAKCGSSFLLETIAKMHFSTAEAS